MAKAPENKRKTREAQRASTGRTPTERYPRRRGRRAEHPSDLTGKGWKDVLLRVKNKIGDHNLSIVAAGVAFYAFLAIFPALAALVSIYGLMIDPQTVQQQLTQATGMLPEQARQVLAGQLQRISAGGAQTLGWGIALSILFALWSANRGTKALFKGINIAYEEKEERGFLKQNALTLAFTLGFIVVAVVSLALIAALPVALGTLGLPPALQIIARVVQWALPAGVILLTLTTVYRFAPDRENARWRWVSWGATTATVLWLIASWAFSFYVVNFNNYNETYGTLGAVVVLLLWFMLSAFIFLLGAEMNSEMEHQTSKDTTTGPEEPMGNRGANHADTVGEKP